MSAHEVKVYKITVLDEHPNADRLELTTIGAYRCCVMKGVYKVGDLVAYIPEQSVLPPDVLEVLGMVDSTLLVGKDKNRVKALKLRKVLSQGLTYPAKPEWVVGQDVAEELGIIKWVPPIPSHMAGEVFAAGLDCTLRYDIENWNRYPDVIQEGEPVVMTEKLHGTFCEIAVMPPSLEHEEQGQFIVASKGQADKGLAFKWKDENGRPVNNENLYMRAARSLNIPAKLKDAVYLAEAIDLPLIPVFLLGEVFGAGVQKNFGYGYNVGQDESIGFRVFDIYVGNPGQGAFMPWDMMVEACKRMGLDTVPLLYRGPFSREKLLEIAEGAETITGSNVHMREGTVCKPLIERRDDLLGRVILKRVSERYLLKGKTTEYV